MSSSSNANVHIAMFPSPGMGHLIPFVHLAKLLLDRRHLSSATLILPSTTPSHNPLLQSLPDGIRLHHLSPIPILHNDDDADNQSPEFEIFRTISLSLASARRALASLSMPGSSLAALVLDPFGLDLLDAAKELHVPTFMYFGTAALNLLFTFHLSRFDKMMADGEEFEDAPEPFVLPGCAPLNGRDFGDPFKCRKSETYKRFLHQSKITASVDGILVNSFIDLESGAITALKEEDPGRPPIFAIGPIVGLGQEPGQEAQPVVEWLDGQPARSILYVSFGSGGTLSYEQTRELALGLEESGQRFLWVIRCPNDANSCPSYCGGAGGGDGVDPLGFLPEGFTERTSGRGMVIPNWAPQVAVLSHESIGGFLTHCGWNSVLESLIHGVPMVAWPLYAEQRTNAVVLTEGLGVALRPEEGEGLVACGEVVRVVRGVMEGGEGERIRESATELKEAAKKALGEGGSSTVAFDELGAMLKALN